MAGSPRSAKPVQEHNWIYAGPMQNDDGTQGKNQEKERVLAAITALKAQGADINPYTVSGEAQVPRSTLYRDPELMDLIYRERNGDDHGGMSNDEQQTRLNELEETNSQLNEQIWELEKQLETMTKAKQDAYVQGFQAGIEEAAKRYGANPAEAAQMSSKSEGSVAAIRSAALQNFGAAAAMQQQSHAPETTADTMYAETGLGYEYGTQYESSDAGQPQGSQENSDAYGEDHQGQPEFSDGNRDQSFSEAASDETLHTNSELADAPTSDSPNSDAPRGRRSFVASDLNEPTGEFEPLGSGYDFGRRPKDSHIAGDFQFNGGSLTAEEPEMMDFGGGQNLHEAPEPAQEEEHDIFDEIESVLADQTAPEPAPSRGPNIDFSLESERAEEPPRKKNSFPDIDFGLSTEESAPHYDSADAAAQTHEQELQPAGAGAGFAAEVARDADGIYNIARSGPTISSSAYNPLVELSWKDLQTVYNFSVASLKDYAKPGFGSEPSPLGGTNFADKTTQQPPKQPQRPTMQQNPNRTADRLEPMSLPPQSFQDPRRTGDRLQAMSDPRDLLNSEAIVDLDALDIFDDLDDYVDLDKIEVIKDVIPEKKKTPEEISKGGDELRELIKGRIKQAAEMPQDQPAPRAAAAPQPAASKDKEDDKNADGKAGAGGARNKFVGGAKSGQEAPAAPATPFVKQIPPEIRRSAMILGIKAEEATRASVIEAWKKQIASPGVHPDLGGDTEAAVFLNTAKDHMVRWIDQQAPKLGKKFGGGSSPGGQPPPRPKQ